MAQRCKSMVEVILSTIMTLQILTVKYKNCEIVHTIPLHDRP